MHNQELMPIHDDEIEPISKIDPEILQRLKQLHEIEGHFITQGVYFDVYGVDLPDEHGGLKPFVFKDFRSGDVTMTPEEQVALFQHQYYEWNALRGSVGRELFPESYWIRSKEFSDDEAHGFYAKPGKAANTMSVFASVQLDRQLASRYSSDDKRQGAIKKIMAVIGETVAPEHIVKPFIGAVVQERIQGVSFADALPKIDKKNPNYPLLRENVRKLIRGLRRYHDENPYGAFTWHGLGSENVMVELDEGGKPSGKVLIIDANFTERPNKIFKDKVIKNLERDVFEKLEKIFDF